MTRINVIPVSDLCDKHLLAEHREIVRVPRLIQKGWRVNYNSIPKEYTLGTGHVKFFYNKISFILSRYLDLYNECKRRGFDIQYYKTSFDLNLCMSLGLMGDYTPKDKDIRLNKERILERMVTMKSTKKSNYIY